MDEPEHRRLRSLVAQAFRQRTLAHWDEDLVVPVVDEMIDRFVDARARPSSSREFTYHYPVQVIAEILGLPARGPRVLPPACARGDQRRGAAGGGHRRERGAARLLRRHRRRAARAPRRRPHQRAGAGRARRRAARRRGDLLVPAAAAPGRRRDHVPRHRAASSTGCSRTPTSSRRCGPTGRSCPGDRGVDPVGGPAADHVARVRGATPSSAACRSRRAAMVIVNVGSANHDETRWDDPTSSTSSASRSRTSRSVSACTCASACTSPAWRWRRAVEPAARPVPEPAARPRPLGRRRRAHPR